MTKMTMEARLRARILRRLADKRGKDDAGVALLSAILFMIIMAGLATLIVSTVLGQVSPTYIAQKETQSVYSAQAGLQAALGVFRTSYYKIAGVTQYDSNGTGVALGDPSELPCGLSGTTDPSGTADGAGYTVTIAYYDADPTGQSSAWLSGPDMLTCTPGAGVTPTSTVPLKFALITSTGTGNAIPGTSSQVGVRSLGAVYEFKVSTVNIAGGLIYNYNSGGAYCLSAVPPVQAGATIQFLPASQCTAANKALQDWSYGADYEIKLASTTADSAAGLCITGPASTTSSGTENAVLQTCVAAPSVNRWNQLWSWYGSNTWQGANSTVTGLSGYNLGYASAATGALLKVYNNTTSNGFSPSTQVGAGAAGFATEEIVNYLEFGRCMDDTGQDTGAAHMISYPCKQDPTSGGLNLFWNQRFYYNEPATGVQSTSPQAIILNSNATPRLTGTPLSSLPASSQYCLITPGFPGTKATSGQLVKLQQCNTASTYNEWTRVYTIPQNYGGSYLFTTTTSTGTLLCLEVNQAITDTGWSELDVAPCLASNLGQKWNAPPAYTASEVGGYKEIGG